MDFSSILSKSFPRNWSKYSGQGAGLQGFEATLANCPTEGKTVKRGQISLNMIVLI